MQFRGCRAPITRSSTVGESEVIAQHLTRLLQLQACDLGLNLPYHGHVDVDTILSQLPDLIRQGLNLTRALHAACGSG